MLKLKDSISKARVFIEAATRSAAEMFEPKLIDDMRQQKFKSREKLIEMPIASFLFLAKPGSSDDKIARVQGILDRKEKFDALPYLKAYDAEYANYIKVDGHEGRHRARALKELGYYSMPVRLITDIRWSEQDDPNKRDYRKMWPEYVEAEKSTERIPFPVKREDADKPYDGKVSEQWDIA